jgi:UDP-N-acetylglucosamine 2-epimerase (non-hydrolysing)
MQNLNVGSGTHAEVTAKMLLGIEKTLINKNPDIVLVLGDTNSVLAGALVSTKLHIPLGHVESGLRSFDRRMPEEYNRIIVDHISDYLFAPTELAQKNLLEEGIGRKESLYNKGVFKPQLHLTGNTIVDVVKRNLDKAQKTSQILNNLKLNKKEYFLVTAHREENVDYAEKLNGIINGLNLISDKYNLPIVYPIHPRTKKRLLEFSLWDKLQKINNLKILEPLGFFDLLSLESNAKLVLTDSGGVQEETCSLNVPCVVLRDKSDRPESLYVGASVLAGCAPSKIIASTELMLGAKKFWKNPFGDGDASEKIVNIIKNNLK